MREFKVFHVPRPCLGILVELDQDARAKSAFMTHQGLFEFVRMPFGLCNAPTTLAWNGIATLRILTIFLSLPVPLMTISVTFVKSLDVFGRLREAGLRLKPKKCLLLHDEVPYLGHVISTQGIHPDPSKTEK